MGSQNAKFSIGQLVKHSLFNYRGAIVDVDPVFQGTEDWYEEVAFTRPPKDKPWYRVLVHNAVHDTYVAERNLESDFSEDPITHPLIEIYFDNFKNGFYVSNRRAN